VLFRILQLLIDGEFVDSISGKTFETEDPRTGEVLVEIAEAQEEDVDKAVKAARKVMNMKRLLICFLAHLLDYHLTLCLKRVFRKGSWLLRQGVLTSAS